MPPSSPALRPWWLPKADILKIKVNIHNVHNKYTVCPQNFNLLLLMVLEQVGHVCREPFTACFACAHGITVFPYLLPLYKIGRHFTTQFL